MTIFHVNSHKPASANSKYHCKETIAQKKEVVFSLAVPLLLRVARKSIDIRKMPFLSLRVNC
jgi:hypothetical protein